MPSHIYIPVGAPCPLQRKNNFCPNPISYGKPKTIIQKSEYETLIVYHAVQVKVFHVSMMRN